MIRYGATLLFTCALVVSEADIGRRIVMPSDQVDDILSKINALEHELQDVKTNLATKDREIAALNQTLGQKDAAVVTMRKKLQAVESTLAGSGSTFVRWGIGSCGTNSTELVYTGFAAGAGHAEQGSGANMLCLPRNPTWPPNDTLLPGGRIYGVQYGPKFQPLDSTHFYHMPCAVCRTHLSTTIMIPASTGCLGNWTMQYTGFLVSSYYDNHPTDYICIDGQPGALYGRESSLAGPEMLVVQAKCGVLPCHVYPDGRQLACSVCSK